MKKYKFAFMGATIVTGLSIAAFLSNKIIENPYQGTLKGGLFAMTGVGIILLAIFITSSLVSLLNRNFIKKEKK